MDRKGMVAVADIRGGGIKMEGFNSLLTRIT
jgi:hypothetical protein